MMPPRERPPAIGDERTQLLGWFDLQRAIVHLKCEGLSESDAHRQVLPDSPRMTMAGVVSHLRWTENCWFQVLFGGQSASANPQFDETAQDADMVAGDVPISGLLDHYEQECAASNMVIAAHALDDVGVHPEYMPRGATLRWIVIHMIEETARHVGHLDAIRELLDGEKSYY